MRFRNHPRLDELEQLVAGDSEEAARRRIRDHLRDCARCQRRLAFVREVREASDVVRHPRPPEDLLEDVLERRAAGERVILPAAAPPSSGTSRTTFLGTALAILLAGATLAGVGLLRTDEASAGVSTLRVRPPGSELTAGEEVELEFRAASFLAGEERLRLRGRYRTAGDPPPRERLGTPFETTLSRADGARYEGRLRLPPSAVYAAFSVEDPEGREVATDGGRLWHVLVEDATGRPLFAALMQKFRVLEKRSWEAALETARQMTELYPEQPEGWAARLLYERFVVAPELRDSLMARHRAQFNDLEQRFLRDGDPQVEELAGLAHYARALGETGAMERWLDRLEARAPLHPLVVQARTVKMLSTREAPAARLRALEEEWRRSGPAAEFMVERGFRAAAEAGEAAAAARWAERYLQLRPDALPSVVRKLRSVPGASDVALEYVERELAALRTSPNPDHRPLDLTVSDERDLRGARRRELLSLKGRLLADKGMKAEALEALEDALAAGWNPELFRRVATSRLEARDTVGAREAYALAAADPLSSLEEHAEFRRALGLDADGSAWRKALEAARRVMQRRIRDRSRGIRASADARVLSDAGESRALDQLAAPGPALLAFWSSESYPSARDLSHLVAHLGQLHEAGVRVVLVTRDEATPELRQWLSRQLEIDAIGAVKDLELGWAVTGRIDRQPAGAWVPAYLVMDGQGRFRYVDEILDEAVRQALVLSESPTGR